MMFLMILNIHKYHCLLFLIFLLYVLLLGSILVSLNNMTCCRFGIIVLRVCNHSKFSLVFVVLMTYVVV